MSARMKYAIKKKKRERLCIVSNLTRANQKLENLCTVGYV
jgi:hypothetical protein